MEVEVSLETWPLKQPFAIAGVTQTNAATLRVVVTAQGVSGQGESEPHISDAAVQARIAESVRTVSQEIRGSLSTSQLRAMLPDSRARNAVDCALWDWRAKARGVPACTLAGMTAPRVLPTAMTLDLDTPERLAIRARKLLRCTLITIKLDGFNDIERVMAVRRYAPRSRLIVDVNGGWSFRQLCDHAPALARLGVALIEQPLPAGEDEELKRYRSPVPLCADESCGTADSLASIARRYRVVNLKLDNCGGFSEAMDFSNEAARLGLRLMVGCNVGTSLAMAPAFMFGGMCCFVDLDGAWLLARDRANGLAYDAQRGLVSAPLAALWG